MGVARRAAAGTDDYTPTAGFEPDPEEPSGRSSSLARPGWGAAKQTISKASSFEAEFKISENEALVKFVEDEPFASVLIHWVDEITEGQRSFYCPEEDCPLCAVGYRRTPQVWFNVVPLSTEGASVKPEMMVLKAGSKLSDLIKAENEGRSGPLSRHFFKVSKHGGGKGKGAPNFSVAVVKARDVVEDWEMNPEEIAPTLTGLKPYDGSVVKFPTRERLAQVVEEFLSH